MDKISFATGSLGNVPVLEKVLKQSIAEIDHKLLLGYSDPSGLPELRKQIADLYYSGIAKENIMITYIKSHNYSFAAAGLFTGSGFGFIISTSK